MVYKAYNTHEGFLYKLVYEKKFQKKTVTRGIHTSTSVH